MKKQLFSYLLLFLLFTSVPAQRVSKPSKEQERLRTHVGYLASDKLEGRKTGETGATFAAGYVANNFARLRLKTAGNPATRSYMQTFPFVTGVQLQPNNSLRINNLQYNVQSDWMPVGFSASGKLSESAMVFADYGIVSNEPKRDDFSGLDVRNKIVLVFAGTPEKGNPRSPFARFADARVKAKIAADKGARGLIVISAEQNFADEKQAKLEYDQTLGETAIPTIIISRSLGAKLLNAKSAKDLDETEKWLEMRKDAPENIRINLANVPPMSAEFEFNLTKTSAEAYNVIGILDGRDAVLRNEAIVIGAHYDHLGRGGKSSHNPNSKEIHNGADDNASGVAAMLELARHFSRTKNNKRTLIFIAFGAEEDGLLGSKHYVNNPVFPLNRTVAMINMDMIGRLQENKLTVGGIGTAGEWGGLVNQKNALEIAKLGTPNIAGNASSIAVSKFNLQLSQDGFGPSDHSSFYGKQIPVLFFFTGTHTDYHKPTDTAEKINYDGLEKITEYVSEIVTAIDQNPKRPTYTTAPSSGMSGSRSGGSFNVSLGTVPGYADNTNDGLTLDGVRDGSPAAKAGVKAGDKITKLAGRDIKNISDYVFILGEMKAGEEYEIVVMRGAEKITLKITPEARN